MGLARLACWVAGHRWAHLRHAGCYSSLMHLSTLMATDADCTRCGKQWRDYNFHKEH